MSWKQKCFLKVDLCLLWLLRISDELFDNHYLTLHKTPAYTLKITLLGSNASHIIHANGKLSLRMTWGLEICFTLFQSEPVSALSLLTICSLWHKLLLVGQYSLHLYLYLHNLLHVILLKCIKSYKNLGLYTSSFSGYDLK